MVLAGGLQPATLQWAGGAVLGVGVSLLAFKQWMQGPRCQSKTRLDGKVVVITGGNTGIGKTTAIDLSRRGAKVVILCRSSERGRAAVADIKKMTGGEVELVLLDLASLQSVRACAEVLLTSLERIDILVNNAAVMACPRATTKDGFELQLGTNHLGHFLLTNLLLPLLKRSDPRSPPARVVTVSALAHEAGRIHWDDINLEREGSYGPVVAYMQSKVANILFSQELGRRWKEFGIHTYSLHPGVIQTELARNIKDSYGSVFNFFFGLSRPLLKNGEQGAQTTIFCCVEESLADHTGRYYSDCRERATAPQADSLEDAEKLWKISEKMTNFKQE